MGKFILLILLGLLPIMVFAEAGFPSPTVRANTLKSLAAEMERLDGEALYVRRNRAMSWDQVVKGLQKEAGDATSWLPFIKSLLRLDLAYPNLHSQMVLGQNSMKYLSRRIKPKIELSAEWLTANQVRYVVSRVDLDVQYAADVAPKVGDAIIAISGRSVDDWKKENFELCKFPLKAQCDFELPSTFQEELLSWSRQDSLTYTLKRNAAIWTIAVDLKEDSTYFPTPQGYSCKQEVNRYSDFKLAYTGNRAEKFENVVDDRSGSDNLLMSC